MVTEKMPGSELVALIKQDLQSVLSIRDPAELAGWKPSDNQRAIYVSRISAILERADSLTSRQRRSLLDEGRVHDFVPEALLEYYREQVEPRLGALQKALEVLDPDRAEWRALTQRIDAPGWSGGRVKDTFVVAVERMYQFLDDHPEREDDFLPDTAFEVIDSGLIGFEPDQWLDRTQDLKPVRTDRRGDVLPAQVRFRLEELYRSYVVGCWISTLALSRSLMEYAVKDNSHKFGIQLNWPAQNALGRPGKEKTLTHLIDECAVFVPEIADEMTRLRSYGNAYIHPSTSRTSKEQLFQRRTDAKDAVVTVVRVVEALYLARKQQA